MPKAELNQWFKNWGYNLRKKFGTIEYIKMINFLLNISSIFSMNLNKYNAKLMPISIFVPYLASDATMNSLAGRV